MAEQFHQGVDAVDQCAAGTVGVDAGAAKRRSTRYCMVPRVMRSPSAPTNSGAADGQAANPPPGEERSCGGGSLDVHRLKYAPCIVARRSVSAEVQIPAGASC